MNLDKYRCQESQSAWRSMFKRKFSRPDIAAFTVVGDRNKFDIKQYTGSFPVGVIYKGIYVLGYAIDTTPVSHFQLHPWCKERFPWTQAFPQQAISYRDLMYALNHRCVQLVDPPSRLTPREYELFENSRHALWLCVKASKCITIDKLIDLEVNYMHNVQSPELLNECKERFSLQEATVEHLEAHIRKMYSNLSFDEENVHEVLKTIGPAVREMLV